MIETVQAPAADLHRPVSPTDGRRHLWHMVPTRPAVVLGSTQPVADVDADRAAAAGVDVARRRSGGGAVWVAPGDPVWLDVWIPRGDRWWTDDVQAAFGPVGAAWRRALEAAGVADLSVHDGSVVCPTGSRAVCFAGLGPGEVVHTGRKVVGISQRRTRDGARFQCAVYRRWDPAPLHGLLAEPPDLAVLRGVAVGLDDLGLGALTATTLVAAVADQFA